MFVTPGGTLTISARVNGPKVHAALVSNAAQRVTLELPPAAAELLALGSPFEVAIPPDTPLQTWDLLLESTGGAHRVPRAVAVRRDFNRVRIVHLSDMNVGEIGAAGFEGRLVDEVNLLAPTVIVATGDFLDISHEQPEAGWGALSAFLAAFDAPVLAACGDHDDLQAYARVLASSPVGAVNIGPHRGLVLYDAAASPAALDPDQEAWLRGVLQSPSTGLTFAVSHSEHPSALAAWISQGTAAQHLGTGRLALWFVGGTPASVDSWNAAGALKVVQTERATSLARDGTCGTACYRVVDLELDRALIPHDASAASGYLPPAIPVGRLNVRLDGPNDGTAERVAATVTNNHAFRLDRLQQRFFLKAHGDTCPTLTGGRLLQAFRVADIWVCDAEFDLADKAGIRLVAAAGPLQAPPTVEVAFGVPAALELQPGAQGGFVLKSAAATEVWLTNGGAAPVTVVPFVRLDGNAVPYRVDGVAGAAAIAYRVRLEPGERTTLQLSWPTARFLPGRRELQVYLKGGPAWSAISTPLVLTAPQQPQDLAAR